MIDKLVHILSYFSVRFAVFSLCYFLHVIPSPHSSPHNKINTKLLFFIPFMPLLNSPCAEKKRVFNTSVFNKLIWYIIEKWVVSHRVLHGPALVCVHAITDWVISILMIFRFTLYNRRFIYIICLKKDGKKECCWIRIRWWCRWRRCRKRNTISYPLFTECKNCQSHSSQTKLFVLWNDWNP